MGAIPVPTVFEKNNLHAILLPTSSTPDYHVEDVLLDSEKMLYVKTQKRSSLVQTEDIFFKVFLIGTDKNTEIAGVTLLMDLELFD